MKFFYSILVFIFIGSLSNVSAQTVNFDKLIPPVGSPNVEFKDFLVQLGWANGPQNRVFQYELKKSQSELQLTKLDWFKDLTFAMNLNENNITKQEAAIGGTTVYDPFPRWNIQATINLGRIIERPVKIDMAQDDIFIAKANLNEQKVLIRTEVLTKHLAYTQSIEIQKIRKQFEEDANQNYTLVSNRFRQGTAPFDDLNRASASLERAKEASIMANGTTNKSKLALEAVIGVSLEKAEEIHKNITSK